MATTKELIVNINKYADYDCNGLHIRVRITDVKQSFGNLRYQIIPVVGDGVVWIAYYKLTNIRKTQ